MSKRVTVYLALAFALSLSSMTAFGGILDYGTPYTDASGVTWSGTSSFDTTGANGYVLSGYVDWIVYGPGQFPYSDSGYTPPAGQYSYVYQIRNTGSVGISDFTFSVDQSLDNIDSFVSSGRVAGTLATDTDFASGQGGFVEWIYTQDAINAGDTSAGLVFASPKAPTVTSTGRVTDGGRSVGVEALAAPGPSNIPEPGTLVLLLTGLLGFVAVARRWRRR
jgi:hypothetical protein